jgi:hypothetical protein
VESTHQAQAIAKIRVYPGADASFTLFSDDGTTYDYEKGAGSVLRFHWDDAAGKLTLEDAEKWGGLENVIEEVVKPLSSSR